jgi:glycopeptide antibiotics resistance protein
MIMNGIWKAKFLQIDFESWYNYNDETFIQIEAYSSVHYSESTLWFDIGFVVYTLIIVASILLILNMVWKIMLMKGEKRLLNGEAVKGGAVA